MNTGAPSGGTAKTTHSTATLSHQRRATPAHLVHPPAALHRERDDDPTGRTPCGLMSGGPDPRLSVLGPPLFAEGTLTADRLARLGSPRDIRRRVERLVAEAADDRDRPVAVGHNTGHTSPQIRSISWRRRAWLPMR
jgi:hypothetical protein